MPNKLSMVLFLGCTAAIGAGMSGCAAPPPPTVVAPPSTVDRAFAAIVGAMNDQNVRITNSDQATGVVTGVKGGITVTATVHRQDDGSARIDFKTRGNIEEDPGLINRIGAAYNARVAR